MGFTDLFILNLAGKLDVLREQMIIFTNGPHRVGRPECGTETEVGVET